MTDMPVYMHFLYSFIATIGFSIFLSSPKKIILASGFAGALGWTSYYFLSTISISEVSANFIATIIVALVSDILARRLKEPTIIFVIPGIIPLVPGLGMYNTMLYLVQNKLYEAMNKGVNVIFVGGAIAMGLLIITSLSRTIHLLKIRKYFNKSILKSKV